MKSLSETFAGTVLVLLVIILIVALFKELLEETLGWLWMWLLYGGPVAVIVTAVGVLVLILLTGTLVSLVRRYLKR